MPLITPKATYSHQKNRAHHSIAAIEKQWQNAITKVICGCSASTHKLIVFLFLLLAQQKIKQCGKKTQQARLHNGHCQKINNQWANPRFAVRNQALPSLTKIESMLAVKHVTD